MAAMSAGVAGSYLGYLMQSAFLGKEQRATKLKSAHTKAARRMTDEMQSLRGPAMKLGQALSLQSGIIPDEALLELSKLQMEAPGMHPSLVRAQFKGSMGGFPEEIFTQFNPEPFAAASLGQVHRAVTREGARVAVKIQYPGIREAVENDFAWFRTVSKPAQVSGHIPKSSIDELQEQILAETDYDREAGNIEWFREHLAPLKFVTVPEVYRKYSSDKVLTMSLLEGQHLDRFLAKRPSQQIRNELGSHLFELFYFQHLKLERFHADPHWGNYLFRDDATIGLVDFGCVKTLRREFVEELHELYLFPGNANGPEFRRLLEKRYASFGEKLRPATVKAMAEFVNTFYRYVYPPGGSEDAIFDFSDTAFLKDYMRGSTNLLRSKGVLPEYILLGRAEMGMYQTLHRLRARVPTTKIVRKHLRS